MALTLWDLGMIGKNPKDRHGNLQPVTQYYELDRSKVINQEGASAVGLINITFWGEEATVFAAKDKAGKILPLMALPCPHWYHQNRAVATPGNIVPYSKEKWDFDNQL